MRALLLVLALLSGCAATAPEAQREVGTAASLDSQVYVRLNGPRVRSSGWRPPEKITLRNRNTKTPAKVLPLVKQELDRLGVTVSGVYGPVAVAKGGTGLSSMGTALQVLRVNAGGTALEWAAPSASDTPWTVDHNAATYRLTGTGGAYLHLEDGILDDGTGNGLTVGATTVLSAAALTLDGPIQVTDSNRLRFGGTTAGFPAMQFGETDLILFGGADGSIRDVQLYARPGGASTQGGNFTIGAGSGNSDTGEGARIDLNKGTSAGNGGDLYLRAGDSGSGTDGVITFNVSGADAAAMNAAGLTLNGARTLSGSAIDTTAGDSATINRMAGRFRKDTTGATFTLTNSLITSSSIVLLQLIDSDLTATRAVASAGAGSATVTFSAAPTANVDVNFMVVN